MKRRILVLLVAAALAVLAAAAPAFAQTTTTAGNQLKVETTTTRLSGTAGQYVRLPAKVSNVSDKPAKDIVAYVTLVEMTKGQKAPVDLEDWSAHRAVTIGSLASGQSRDVSWRLRLIKGGDYVIYANAIVNGSSRAAVGQEVRLRVTAHKNLNPGGVLPVALGVPVLAGAALFAPVFIRRRKLTT
jgi:hypothetical protein